MAYNIFDWVKEVTERKGNWDNISEEDKQSFNPYMLNRVLSMNQNYIELVSYVQKFWALDNEMIFSIYKQFLPKERVWSKYIKSSKDKANEDVVKAISTYYQISNRESKQYLKFLTEEDQIKILQALGTPEDEINKLYGNIKRDNGSKSEELSKPKGRGRPKKNS